MKKLIYGGLLMAALGIGFIGCDKNVPDSNKIGYDSENRQLSIGVEVLQDILSSNNEKQGPGWEKFKKWVKAHTGNTQRYNDGQPVCMGNGGCGPCPGICFGSTMYDGGNNGSSLTDDEYNSGVRLISLTILENPNNSDENLLLIGFPTDIESEFILNQLFIIDSKEYLPEFYSNQAGYSTIEVEPGNYRVTRDVGNNLTFTVVNISVTD